MIKKAVILAAGEGRRLKPFTETMPKVMIPIVNKPIVDHVIDSVFRSGIKDIILVVGYKKEIVIDYFRENENITFVVQDKQLGTAHALLQAKEYIDEPFIVLAGDNIIDHKSIDKLIKSKSEISMLIKESSLPSKYGVVFLSGNRVKGLLEKPTDEKNRFVATGIYKFPASALDEIEKLASQGLYDMPYFLQTLLDRGKKIEALLANRWMDVVYPWDIIDVNEEMICDFSRSIGGLIEKNVTLKGNVSIGEDSVIYAGTYIQGPVVIGRGCEIGPNVCVFPSTVIGNNVVIHPFSEIRHSVIMDDVSIGSDAYVSNSVIGKGSKIGSHFSTVVDRSTVEIEGEFKKLDKIGAIIGEDCDIKDHVVVEPGVIIGRRCVISPFKHIIRDVASESRVI